MKQELTEAWETQLKEKKKQNKTTQNPHTFKNRMSWGPIEQYEIFETTYETTCKQEKTHSSAESME